MQGLQSVRVLELFGTVLWLGGLMRVIAEVAMAALKSMAPDGFDSHTTFSFFVAILLTALFYAVTFPWYRRMYRQGRKDVAALVGRPYPASPGPDDEGVRASRLRAVVVGVGAPLSASLILALFLPGLPAAAVALVIGLGLRVSAAFFATAQ